MISIRIINHVIVISFFAKGCLRLNSSVSTTLDLSSVTSTKMIMGFDDPILQKDKPFIILLARHILNLEMKPFLCGE